jgi:uncharacterized integral membrane protein (TIGR00698 family)
MNEMGSQEKGDGFVFFRKEDWLAVFIGFGLLFLVAANIIPWVPKVGAWTTSITDAFKVEDLPYFILLGVGFLAITAVAVKLKEGQVGDYWKGFPLIFVLAFVAFIVSKQETINYWGLSHVLWALLIGLIISNVIGTPTWLKSAVKTELFIKIGLVVFGAQILFPNLVKGGAVGIIQALVGMTITWYFCYYLAVKTGIAKSFASIMASGVSICGVSAAIAAGGAIKGEKKEISYVVSMVLLTSIAMLVGEPVIVRMLNLPSAVAGAWIGGTIDTTGAVVAAGALVDQVAMEAATVVKLSQNVLIGLVAFILASYWTLRIEATPDEKPKIVDIWYRFPKFIVGFLVASLVFSFILTPALGGSTVSSILKITKGIRNWFFTLSFVCIGLETRFVDLLEVGGKKAALVYTSAQILNIVLAYSLAWLLFGGIFFPSPV